MLTSTQKVLMNLVATTRNGRARKVLVGVLNKTFTRPTLRIRARADRKERRAYRRSHRQHRVVRPFVHNHLVELPEDRCRTVIEAVRVKKMVKTYLTAGASMRELAAKFHCAIPIVKRTLLRAGVTIKPQGRPRKEAVA